MNRSLICICVFVLALAPLLSGCQGKEESVAQELMRKQQASQRSQLEKSVPLEERLSSAEQMLADGNVVAARETALRLLLSNAEEPDVVLLAAHCEAASGNAIAAATMLDEIDDWSDEKRAAALWKSAEWLIDASEFELAEQRLRRLLAIDPDATRVHRRLAMLLSNVGRRIEAAENFNALARSGAIREKELFAMQCYSEPFIDESMAEPDWGDEMRPAAIMRAKIDLVEGRTEKALFLAETLAAAFPESTAISTFLGRLLAEFQSDQDFGRWIESAPEGVQREPQYWHALGTWMQRQDQHEEAVRCFSETVIRDPTDRDAYAKLAVSLRVVGEHEKAKEATERVELLIETAKLAQKIGREPGTVLELRRMADLLDQLNRPWESLGWRRIAIKQNGGSDDEEAAFQERLQSLQSADTETPDIGFLTCGLKSSDWPLPVIQSIVRADPSGDDRGSKKQRLDKQETPIRLADVASEVGLDFQYDNGHKVDAQQYLHQLTGGGIGVIDFDLDGSFDLYFSQGGGDAFDPSGNLPNQLFRNLSGRRFVEVGSFTRSDDRGYGQGVTVSDVNQDGFPDLLIANIGPNRLFLNQGDGCFREYDLPTSGNDGGWTSSIACGDLSGDHLPEVFVVNYIDDPSAFTVACDPEDKTSCNPRRFQPAVDEVWQVTSDMSILPWDGCEDIGGKTGYSFGVVMTDFDGIAGNEVFISNDGTHNHYWVSRSESVSGSRRLAESSRIYGCDSGLFGELPGCMGIAFGDFDRNGMLDLHISNFWNQPADLYLQDANGVFSNATVRFGLESKSRRTVGWGTHAVDLDRDGWLDLAVLNGHLQDFSDRQQPYRMHPQLFRGTSDAFQDAVDEQQDGSDYWSTPALGRTLAVLDWDADSRPDFVSNHLDVPVALLENRGEGGNSIQLELVGTISERDAIGASARVTCGEETWVQWVVGGDGLLCTNEPTLDFGIGDFEMVDELEVRWPSGETQRFENLSANKRLLIIESNDRVFPRD